MRSIRAKLLTSFIAVIAVLLAMSGTFMIMHVSLIKQYRDITDNMIDEYRLTEISTELTDLFPIYVKSIDDGSLKAQYDAYHAELQTIFQHLDAAIVNRDSRVAYLGLKNSITTLTQGIDAGVAAVRNGDISGVGSAYDDALHQSYFVRENAATLILDDLQYTEQLRGAIAERELWNELAAAALFILIALASAIYSVLFSRRLAAPLGKLTRVAKDVTSGDVTVAIDPTLLVEKDEVGILARAFDVMLQSLRSTIRALDTEKKNVEKKVVLRTRELQEERARFLASVNSLSLGFLLIDVEGHIILSNPVIQRLLSPGNPTFDRFSALFHPAIDVDAFHARVRAGERYELSETAVRDSFFRIIAMPVSLEQRDRPGEIIGSVIVVEDITDEKRLKQSKDAFLAIAAHEMRTPLTVIRGNAELMLDAPAIKGDRALDAQTKSVLESAVRLLGIVNDFLDVQNLETGRIALNVEPVNVLDALRKTIADLAPLAARKGISLVLEPTDTAIPPIPLDRFRFQQVLVNLIGNAIHYTERGGVTVSVKKEDGRLTIAFRDTGIGIDKEEQGRLFQKFEAGRTFIRSRDYGSGLGLYISRFLAHLMKGDVVLVASEVGVGSTFALVLPLPS